MVFPLALQEALDESLEGISLSSLKSHVEALSDTYRRGGTSQSIFDNEKGLITYLATRMPATFGAVSGALLEMQKQMPDWKGETLLDLGSGPGTASWAALEIFPSLTKSTLIDRSPLAIEWGKKLSKGNRVLANAEWIQRSLNDLAPLPKADLAILSYTVNELQEPENLIQKIWDTEIPLVLIVEPGTPQGFKNIRKLRDFWIAKGGFLVAPCPHALACPMQIGDWCHFSARISRTKLHRMLKGGDLGYEDEKFSYVVLSRIVKPLPESRILRHPSKNKGHVQMVLCTKSGQIENKTISRRDLELYKIARKSEWGDSM